MQYKRETLCWSCQRAVCGCSWSKEFKPVEGWDATVTNVRFSTGESNIEETNSFCVKSCPLYLRDEPRKNIDCKGYDCDCDCNYDEEPKIKFLGV